MIYVKNQIADCDFCRNTETDCEVWECDINCWHYVCSAHPKKIREFEKLDKRTGKRRKKIKGEGK